MKNRYPLKLIVKQDHGRGSTNLAVACKLAPDTVELDELKALGFYHGERVERIKFDPNDAAYQKEWLLGWFERFRQMGATEVYVSDSHLMRALGYTLAEIRALKYGPLGYEIDLRASTALR